MELQKLAGLMVRMAAGDGSATFELYEQFGHRIAGVLRRHLSRLGVYDIEADELHGLVIDTCLMLETVAGAWRPDGGALPWNWAGARVGGIVSGWVGQHATEFDVERHEEVVIEQLSRVEDELEEIEVLAGLCDENPACALLFEALGRVATSRDRRILLAVRSQTAAGDPSPAVTVGQQFGMKPEAVRQVACRVRRSLRTLAATEGRFAPLERLALLA